MRKIIVGVIGPGRQANVESIRNAVQLGVLIATEGWVLLTGGRNCGVMNAANEGAKQANGLTVGILPNNDHSSTSSSVDIAILTGMGQARNNINALSSDLLIACGLGPGTASEIALAIKANKKVILLRPDPAAASFFQNLGPQHILVANTAEEAIDLAKNIINASDNVQPLS